MNIKKEICLSIALCIVLLSSVVFAATNFTVKFEANKGIIRPGDKVEIALKLEDFFANEKGINVLLGTLEFDKTIFDELSTADLTTMQYWGTPTYNVANGKLLLDSHTFVNVPHNALKITLTVKNEISDVTSTQIKLKDIEASDGEKDLKVEDAVINFQIEKLLDKNVDSEDANSKATIIGGAIIAVLIVGIGIIVVIRKKK